MALPSLKRSHNHASENSFNIPENTKKYHDIPFISNLFAVECLKVIGPDEKKLRLVMV